MSEKNKLAEKLLYAPKNGYDRLSAEDEKAMEAYCEDYKKFLNNGKTERLCVEYCIELAKQHGFVEFQPGMALKTGDKVYCNNRGKGIMLAVIGKEPLSEGANIAAAHTDAKSDQFFYHFIRNLFRIRIGYANQYHKTFLNTARYLIIYATCG